MNFTTLNKVLHKTTNLVRNKFLLLSQQIGQENRVLKSTFTPLVKLVIHAECVFPEQRKNELVSKFRPWSWLSQQVCSGTASPTTVPQREGWTTSIYFPGLFVIAGCCWPCVRMWSSEHSLYFHPWEKVPAGHTCNLVPNEHVISRTRVSKRLENLYSCFLFWVMCKVHPQKTNYTVLVTGLWMTHHPDLIMFLSLDHICKRARRRSLQICRQDTRRASTTLSSQNCIYDNVLKWAKKADSGYLSNTPDSTSFLTHKVRKTKCTVLWKSWKTLLWSMLPATRDMATAKPPTVNPSYLMCHNINAKNTTVRKKYFSTWWSKNSRQRKESTHANVVVPKGWSFASESFFHLNSFYVIANHPEVKKGKRQTNRIMY